MHTVQLLERVESINVQIGPGINQSDSRIMLWFLLTTQYNDFISYPGQYSHDSGAESHTYHNVPEEIRRFIHFFHQHVTEQVSTHSYLLTDQSDYNCSWLTQLVGL